MKAIITYEELVDVIRIRMNHSFDLSFVDTNTIKVSKGIKVPLFGNKIISMNISVIEVIGHDVRLKFLGDVASTLVSWIKDRQVSKYASISGDSVIVHLDHIDQVDKLLCHVDLKSVYFSEEGVILCLNNKLTIK